MIQVHADGALVYDSRLPGLELLALSVHKSVTKAGTAELLMPPSHPAFNKFVSYKTVVTVHKNGKLLFRGRSLFPSDDFYNCRTITCEGERGFLRDGVMRPYLYQDAPGVIFEHVIGLYNAQVEPFKQFVVGTVDVTDPNNYVRLESEKAEQIADTIDKLVERVGGYIVFTTTADGQRAINWYKDIGTISTQPLAFGENLLDYARSDANDSLATVVVPYGAKDETTGERVTIASVNDGLDFIQDYDAVAVRGVVAVPVYWDDVTDPSNLLAKAQQYLTAHKNVITSLELSAVDLSNVDVYIDSLEEGDLVQVRSKPHNVDDWFRITDRDYDLLQPEKDKVVAGKEVATLSGSDAAGDRHIINELDKTIHEIRTDYQLNIEQAVEAAQTTLASLIEQTSEAIKLEISEQYVTGETLNESLTSTMTQLVDSFNFEFETLRAIIDDNNTAADERFKLIESWVRIEKGEDGTAKLVLGNSESPIQLELENNILYFSDGGARVAYMSDKKLVITDAHFLTSLQIGNFKFVPRQNGNLSLIKVG